MSARYSRTIVVDAMRFTGENWDEVIAFVGEEPPSYKRRFITTLTGAPFAVPGDWLVKGSDGVFSAMTDDEFLSTFEEASDE